MWQPERIAGLRSALATGAFSIDGSDIRWDSSAPSAAMLAELQRAAQQGDAVATRVVMELKNDLYRERVSENGAISEIGSEDRLLDHMSVSSRISEMPLQHRNF